MIEFLVGAFAVLRGRADKIVQILDAKREVPASVVAHCRRVSVRTSGIITSIDNKQDLLRQVIESLAKKKTTLTQANTLLKPVMKSYRDSRREIDVIEENFVGHLVRFNNADLFFTQLAAALWQETNLPDTPPVAVTNTSGYFCTWAALGIIFSPPSSEHHLLIFPDLYHEFGHILHQGLKIELFGKRFESELKAHISELTNKIRRTSRPMDKEMMAGLLPSLR